MSNPTPNLMLAAAWRVLPAADRWRIYQSQLSRRASPESHPWTRRSVVSCDWRVPAVHVSAKA